MDTNRQVRLSHPSRTYSVEGPDRPYACQTSLTPSLSKTGDCSNSTSRSVVPLSSVHVSLLLTFEIFAQPDSVHTVEDALAYISRPQPVHVGQSSSSEVSQQVQIEALPSVLVLHLERFLYDAAADGIVKISKPVQFPPELEIPLGKSFSTFSFVSPVLLKAKNPFRLGWSRNHGTHDREIFGAGALQALWGVKPPRRVRRQRALYGRLTPSEPEEWYWGSLAAH
jgi:hypothetical protein